MAPGSPAYSDAFRLALASILASEGGAVDDPHDPGGPTHRGVTAATLREAKAAGIVPAPLELAELTEADAAAIYHELCWLPVRGDELPAPLALVAFDAAVNQGPPAAVAMLQTALRVKVDGTLGPVTLAAARRSSSDALDVLLARRAERYADLCYSKPVLLRYRHGWLTRCFRVARLAARIGG